MFWGGCGVQAGAGTDHKPLEAGCQGLDPGSAAWWPGNHTQVTSRPSAWFSHL